MRQTSHLIKPAALAVVAFVGLMSMSAFAQEDRSEISVQGTGFFTKNSDGNGIRDRATETGGFLVGYRYNITHWLAAEANYGYDRNTQSYFGGTTARVQANIHTITGSAVVKLPGFAKLQPYLLGGGGADYAFTRHISLRAEYRGYVYKAPDFYLKGLNTDTWTHIAQPSAGIVYRF